MGLRGKVFSCSLHQREVVTASLSRRIAASRLDRGRFRRLDIKSARVGDAFVHQALGFSFSELGELDNAVRAWLRALELESNCDFTHLARIPRRGPI